MKKILILGAGSYIGTSFEEYMKDFADEYSVSALEAKGLVPSADMFEGYDVVFNVAGIAHVKETKQNRQTYYDVNEKLAVAAAKAAREAGVGQFIQMSTMSVYGKLTGHITKNDAPAPRGAYGDSKYRADKALEEERDENFKVAILRPPMVYGKGCRGNYGTLRKFALRSPVFPKYKNERSMIYIANLCAFVRAAIDGSFDGTFFPQNAEYVCTSEMVRLIAWENGKKVRLWRIFTPFIKILPLGTLKKVFGTLTYEKTDTVDEYGFCESIQLCER